VNFLVQGLGCVCIRCKLKTRVFVTVCSMKEKINNQKVARAVTDSIMAEVRDSDRARQRQRQGTETTDRNGDRGIDRHRDTETQTATNIEITGSLTVFFFGRQRHQQPLLKPCTLCGLRF
jgi:hypothetical protein